MLADHPDTQVNSTNYASLPKVRSQGQGHGSVTNGLLAYLKMAKAENTAKKNCTSNNFYKFIPKLLFFSQTCMGYFL